MAIPSELRGYHEAYLKYGGGVPWKRLFEPSIKICREGYLIQKFLASHIQRFESDIYGSPTLRYFAKIFFYLIFEVYSPNMTKVLTF